MKNQHIAISFLIIIISFMLTACGKSGVERPIKIDGLNFQITNVEIKDEYQMGLGSGQTLRPQSNFDQLLIVTAEMEATYDDVVFDDWDVEVEGGKGFFYTSSVQSKNSTETQELTSLKWIFAVHSFEDSFIFHINDAEIALDSFLPEISDLNQEKNAGEIGNDNVISISVEMCDQDIALSSEKEIEIYYLEKVGDEELAKQYVNDARLEVTLDGETINMDPGEVLQDDDYGTYVRFRINIGKLNPGEHVIDAKLIFRIDIQVEEIYYGSYTTNENSEFTCLISSR